MFVCVYVCFSFIAYECDCVCTCVRFDKMCADETCLMDVVSSSRELSPFAGGRNPYQEALHSRGYGA